MWRWTQSRGSGQHPRAAATVGPATRAWRRLAGTRLARTRGRRRARLEALAAQLQQRELRVAQLCGELEERDERLANARASLLARRGAAAAGQSACACCCDLVAGRCVECDADVPHRVCVGCLAKHLRARFTLPCAMPVNRVACFAAVGCAGVLDASALCATSPGTRVLRDYHFSQGVGHVLRLLRDTLGDAAGAREFEAKLNFMTADGTFRGYGCARCRYGPMWHGNCDDLTLHHLQRTPQGRTSNACPRCGHAACDVSQLERWTGELATCAAA